MAARRSSPLGGFVPEPVDESAIDSRIGRPSARLGPVPEAKLKHPGWLRLRAWGTDGVEIALDLVGTRWTVGRRDANSHPDFDLSACETGEGPRSVSRRHAEVTRGGDGYFVVDLGSANGTSIDGVVIASGVSSRLEAGSIVAFGRVEVKVE